MNNIDESDLKIKRNKKTIGDIIFGGISLFLVSILFFFLAMENKYGTFKTVALGVFLWDKRGTNYGSNRFTFSGQGYDG